MTAIAEKKCILIVLIGPAWFIDRCQVGSIFNVQFLLIVKAIEFAADKFPRHYFPQKMDSSINNQFFQRLSSFWLQHSKFSAYKNYLRMAKFVSSRGIIAEGIDALPT